MENKIKEIQKEVGKLVKDTKGYNYKYYDINQLLEKLQPLFDKHNILCTQPLLNGKVKTILKDMDSDKHLVSEIKLPEGVDPQKLGSAITYFRRYTLVSLLALQAEDDDGKTASEGLSEIEFGKLREAYKRNGTMGPDLQDKYALCNLEQKRRIADITKELRQNK
jgi:hypothetical protein